MGRKNIPTVEKEPETRRIARRERRRAQSREEILDAAMRVLVRDGVSKLTLDSVARELELTKAALYYYYRSKDALLFELMIGHFQAEAHAIAAAVERAETGADALRAIIETMFSRYSGNYDAFRLMYMQAQVMGYVLGWDREMWARVRPLNDLMYGAAQKKLERDRRAGRMSKQFDPRRLAFLAHTAAIGALTVKGMAEAQNDPLVHRDADLMTELGQVFAAVAGEGR